MQVTETTLKVELTIAEADILAKALMHDSVERAKHFAGENFAAFKELHIVNFSLLESLCLASGHKTMLASTITACGAQLGVAAKKRKRRASITKFEDSAKPAKVGKVRNAVRTDNVEAAAKEA